jgi:curved DNA-binding protein CbpA
MASTTLDPYMTLGIPARASRAEAGRAHRRLAKQFHPDVNPGAAAAERMRRINEAWRILSDPARRAQYDADRVAAHWPGADYGARRRADPWAATSHAGRTRAATWTAWPGSRGSAAPRMRRPARPKPAAPSFGDRPAVVVAAWISLSLLFFLGSWLGSLAP